MYMSKAHRFAIAISYYCLCPQILSDGLSNENILLFPVLIQARRNIFTANFFIDTEYELYHYFLKKNFRFKIWTHIIISDC